MEDNGSVSLRLCLDGHANSLALNKENNCIAVAGRSCEKFIKLRRNGNFNNDFSSVEGAEY